MLKQTEGSHAVAEAIALCRPQVICAYPITPQTHIVEGLGEMVKSGELDNCEFINVESEFAALSVAIGSSAAGARTYTATSSQGLLFMAEAVYNAAGLGLPIVMTIGNRAIGAPINIWNDHSDSMSMRDAGWIQLFAETNQEALDLHIQAFKLAEDLSCPVMVCMDGFILTHAYDRVDVPTQAQVGCVPAALPAAADPRPARAGQHRRAWSGRRRSPRCATSRITSSCARSGSSRSSAPSSRSSSGATRAASSAPTAPKAPRRSWSRWARSTAPSRKWSTRCARMACAIGSVSICSFRPFPLAVLREALCNAQARGRAREMPRGRAWAASCPTACASRSRASSSTATPSSRASADGRSRARRCAACSRTRSATSSSR